VFIAGALIAFAKAAQWTQGWQKYEARESAHSAAAEALEAREAAIAARESEFDDYGLTPVDEYDQPADGYDALPEDYDEWLPADPELDGEDVELLESPGIEPAER
jgi:hypothetical protein